MEDIQEVCDKCCDDNGININNEYIGQIFQWLLDNGYTIIKK